MPLQVLEHLDVLKELLVGFFSVPVGLLDSGVEGLNFISPALLEFSDGLLLLGLKFLQLGLQVG